MSNPDWWLDPPDDRHENKCECGDSHEDHNTTEDLLDARVLLESLQDIDDQLNRVHPLNTEKAIPYIRKILDATLAVCAHCDCRKFVEADDVEADDE